MDTKAIYLLHPVTPPAPARGPLAPTEVVKKQFLLFFADREN